MIREPQPQDFLVGFTGELRAMIPPRVAALMIRSGVIRSLRKRFPGDAELASVLVALHAAGGTVGQGVPLLGTRLPLPREQPPSLFWTTSQAAEELRITKRAVCLAVKRGRLKATMTNGRYTFDPAEVLRYKARQN